IELTPVEQLIPGILTDSSQFHTKLDKREFLSKDEEFTKHLLRWSLENNQVKEQGFYRFFRPFEDQIVVDLGPGRNRNGYIIANLNNARGYAGVEVDHFNYEALKKAIVFP